MKRSTLWLATALLLSSCGGGAETPSTGDPGAGGPASSSNGTAAEALRFAFHDVTEAAGLAGFEQVNGTAEKLMIVETVGGGVALFDADLDGDLDAYLTNGGMLEGLEPGEEPRDAFYLNDGTGTFTDATERAGLGDELWTNGVIVADVNGDDWLDLYLTNYGPNRLYLNRGDGTFEDVTERAGVGDDRWSTGASFFDFDKDGDLDLYVANYIVFDEEVMLTERPLGTLQPSMQGGEDEVYTEQAVMFGPQGMPPERDAFFVNNGDGTFTNRSEELGVGVESENYGFQTLAFDADGDGWVDVYVANDLNENLLWHNDEGQGFSNQALELGLAVSLGGMPQGGMGACVGDFDNDLVADVYVTNFVEDYSTLYRGHKSGTFRDSTSRMRLNNVTWSLSGWGCEFADFDSDGGLELLACHGHVYPQVDLLNLGTSYLQRNLLFTLTDGALVEPPGSGGPGLEPKEASRGLAIGDVDGDGDLDALIGNIDGTPRLLENRSPNGHWLRVDLRGPRGGNRYAVGARLSLVADGQLQMRLIGAGGGFLSSSDPRQQFGLGTNERVESLEVLWPDGHRDRFEDLAVDRIVRIEREGEGSATLTVLGGE